MCFMDLRLFKALKWKKTGHCFRDLKLSAEGSTDLSLATRRIRELYLQCIWVKYHCYFTCVPVNSIRSQCVIMNYIYCTLFYFTNPFKCNKHCWVIIDFLTYCFAGRCMVLTLVLGMATSSPVPPSISNSVCTGPSYDSRDRFYMRELLREDFAEIAYRALKLNRNYTVRKLLLALRMKIHFIPYVIKGQYSVLLCLRCSPCIVSV